MCERPSQGLPHLRAKIFLPGSFSDSFSCFRDLQDLPGVTLLSYCYCLHLLLSGTVRSSLSLKFKEHMPGGNTRLPRIKCLKEQTINLMNGYMNEAVSEWEVKRWWWMHFSMFGSHSGNFISLYIMYIFIPCRLNSDFKTQAGFPTMLLSFLEETNSVSFVCMYYIVLFSDVHLECVAECNYGS